MADTACLLNLILLQNITFVWNMLSYFVVWCGIRMTTLKVLQQLPAPEGTQTHKFSSIWTKKKTEKEHDTTRQHLTKYITAANSSYPSTQPRWWQIVSYRTSSVHFDKTNFPLTHRIPQSSHLWTFPVVSTMGSVGCVELKARKRRRGEIESRKVEGGQERGSACTLLLLWVFHGGPPLKRLSGGEAG